MDDSRAIESCRRGDRDAFRYVVERYQAQAVFHAAAILGSRDDAMDAVQEAFLDAFGALRRFDTARKFYPWFYVLLRNRCYKMMASRKRHEAADLEQTLILAPASGTPREELISLEMALMELEPEDRELITLKHLDGLSYEELASRLDIAEGTVMSRLYHARKRLAEKLARRSTKSLSKVKHD
jgi:RNA polymerase sigma-70 factor (ECF subfamily)